MLSFWSFLFVTLNLLDSTILAEFTRNALSPTRLAEPESRDLDHKRAILSAPQDQYVRRISKGPIEFGTTLSQRESILETSAIDWRIIIYRWMAFDPSSNNTSTLSSMYAGIGSRISQKFGLSAPRQSVSFSFGSLSLTFQSLDEVVP